MRSTCFFIELGSRRVHLAGCTPNPRFTHDFDEVFRSEGLEIIRTPFRAPKANAIGERFVRTLRAECLDWLLVAGKRQLERALCTFTDHYNNHRPRRALDLTPPQRDRPPLHLAHTRSDRAVQRRDRLGGLIHEYSLAA